MKQELNFLADEDVIVIRELIAREKQRKLNPPSRTPFTPNTDQTPEVYIVRTPVGGIPAMDVHPTGQDRPGVAFADVYRLLQNEDTGSGHPSKLWLVAFDQEVFNLSTTAIFSASSRYCAAVRDKWGKWLATPIGAGEGGGSFTVEEINGVPTTTLKLLTQNTSLLDNLDDTATLRHTDATHSGLVSYDPGNTQVMGDGDKTFQETVIVNSRRTTGVAFRVDAPDSGDVLLTIAGDSGGGSSAEMFTDYTEGDPATNGSFTCWGDGGFLDSLTVLENVESPPINMIGFYAGDSDNAGGLGGFCYDGLPPSIICSSGGSDGPTTGTVRMYFVGHGFDLGGIENIPAILVEGTGPDDEYPIFALSNGDPVGIRYGYTGTGAAGDVFTGGIMHQAGAALGDLASADAAADVGAAALTDPADSPASADALRDDLVANLIPSIAAWMDDLRSKLQVAGIMS